MPLALTIYAVLEIQVTVVKALSVEYKYCKIAIFSMKESDCSTYVKVDAFCIETMKYQGRSKVRTLFCYIRFTNSSTMYVVRDGADEQITRRDDTFKV